jgi:hypothetical protein
MDAALVVAVIGVFVVGLAAGGVMVIVLPLFRDRRSKRAAQREPDGPAGP